MVSGPHTFDESGIVSQSWLAGSIPASPIRLDLKPIGTRTLETWGGALPSPSWRPMVGDQVKSGLLLATWELGPIPCASL